MCAFFAETFEPVSKGLHDASNNGLQVEGRATVEKIAFAVDACAATIEEAANKNADMLFVHHGVSWKDSLKYVTGINARRLTGLLRHGISLYASHLPLDAHPEFGHNVQISQLLGLKKTSSFFDYDGIDIGVHGEFDSMYPVSDVVAEIEDKLITNCHVIGETVGIKSLGIVSGGGAGAISECAERGIDCLLTGEMGHVHYHEALELGVGCIAAGHYRTEVPGLLAIMEQVQSAFDVNCEFIEMPTGF
jgi:dinuclear metal center YbgI/SA1388 family protein